MKNKIPAIRFVTLMFAVFLAVVAVPVALATVESGEGSQNLAPVAENLEFTTYKGVAIMGTLQAVDPEGDMIEFKMISEPKKGAAVLAEDGSFTYTPNEGKKGKDTFTYVVVDSMGNVSEEAIVKVVIEKQSTDVTYSDLEGSSEQYAALKLAEEGLFVGEKIGDQYFFNSDQTVSRGEFLAMCLNASGVELVEGITRTGFADDNEIDTWLKPYVTTALMSGTVQGRRIDSGTLYFAPNEPITAAEASVMLNNVLEISDVSDDGSGAEDGLVPTWAYQATLNLSACRIIPAANDSLYDDEMTRAGAAQMLCSALDLLASDSSNSLLSWAF